MNSGKPELNARLTADIDLSGVCSAAAPWTPIGDQANNQDYRGTFDGQNHKITGLYLENKGSLANVSSYYTALFGLCDGAAIKNVSVYGEAKAVTRYVAGIVGRACGISTKRTCTIENCHNYVTLTGEPTNDQIYGHAGVAASAQDTVILSDLHLGYHNRRAELSKWVDMINAEHADLRTIRRVSLAICPTSLLSVEVWR